MKVFCISLILLIGLCLLCVDIVAQNKGKQEIQLLSLRGEVESVEIREIDSSLSLIEVKLRMVMTNVGTKPIIFLKQGPLFVGASLVKNPDDFKIGDFLASNYGGPSNSIDSEWATLRTNLDKLNPPPDETRILMPNETWQMETSARVSVPTKSGKGTFSRKVESLEVLQQLSPVWLRIVGEVWPFNVEEPGYDREKLNFGHKLQKRWKDEGLLWLENIYSEPIKLDLAVATYKPLSL